MISMEQTIDNLKKLKEKDYIEISEIIQNKSEKRTLSIEEADKIFDKHNKKYHDAFRVLANG